MAIRRAILLGGLIAAVAASAYWTRFDVRGTSVDGGESGGRLTRPLWNAPHRGDTVEFVRHTGLADLVVVESATRDTLRAISLFAGILVVAGLLAYVAGRRSPAEQNL